MRSEDADSAPPSFFDRNLKAFLAPSLIERVRLASSPEIEICGAPGSPGVVKAEGRALCSARDPVAEARRWAQAQPLDAGSYVIFGLGAGYHVEALRRCTAAPILVVEPDLALISCALRSRLLDAPGVVFVHRANAVERWVGVSVAPGQDIELLSWPPSRRRYGDELFAAVRAAIVRGAGIAGVTASTLKKRLGVWLDCLFANLLQLPGRVPAERLNRWARGRPAFVVAAGPSLRKNAALLRQVGNRGVILAVNTSLAALESVGVRADLVVVLESLDVSRQLVGLDLNGGCPRAVALTANPRLFKHEAPVFPFVEAVDYFAPFALRAGFDAPISAGGSVANSAFALARALGSRAITLVGQDLAYSEGEAYAPGTIFGQMRVELTGGMARLSNLEAKAAIAASCPQIDNTREQERVVEVRAWGDRGTVWATDSFNYFRSMFEGLAERVEGISLTNATEGGARIEGFAERPLAAVVDELPAAPAPLALPEGPALSAAGICNALRWERGRVVQACAIAGKGPEALSDLGAAVKASGLLSAASWVSSTEVVGDPSAGPELLCQRIDADGRALVARIDHALGQLEKRPTR